MRTIELPGPETRVERPVQTGRRPLIRMADVLTALRAVFLLPLWWLALTGHGVLLGIGLLITASTDVTDGWFARRQGPSKLGSQLDSIADLLMTVSTVAWLVLLRPDVVRGHVPLILVWAATGLFGLAVGWVRFRRVGNVHLYSAKFAGLLAYIVVVALFLGWHPAPVLINAVLVVCILATAEVVYVLSTRPHVDEHIGSVFRKARSNTNAPRT